MEGYLAVYYRKKYTRFWCVLDGQQFSYYERLDLGQQMAVGIKGTFFIRNAEVQLVVHETRPNVIRIRCEGRKNYEYLDTDKSSDGSIWYQSIMKAVNLHEAKQNKTTEMAKYATTLGMDPTVKITMKNIAKSYRKLCLKAHPDKGGDVSEFNNINHAYNKLMALQAELEAREISDEFEYEAIVEKGPDGVGLGLVVTEDTVRGRIVVQAMNTNMLLRGLSKEAGGAILPGDCLVGIDRDDCSHWAFSRVKARLNSFRLSVGSTARLRFQRRYTGAAAGEGLEEDTVKEPVTPLAKASRQETQPAEVERDENDAADALNKMKSKIEADMKNNDETPFQGSAIDALRETKAELEKTKVKLLDAVVLAKTWLDRSVEVSAELERARDELEKANETIMSMKMAAEKSSGEVSVLKSRISMLENNASSPGPEKVLLTIEDVFDIKSDKAEIKLMLQQLKKYCGEATYFDDNDSTISVGLASISERNRKFKDNELLAEQLEKDILSLLASS